MAVTIKLSKRLNPYEEQWLAKNVGPRLHYFPSSIGGQGWLAKIHIEPVEYTDIYGKTQYNHGKIWYLTLEEDKFASWFLIMFPQ